ncbi:zinc finger, CCHC-type containing protein [Tanacetum coccineum]
MAEKIALSCCYVKVVYVVGQTDAGLVGDEHVEAFMEKGTKWRNDDLLCWVLSIEWLHGMRILQVKEIPYDLSLVQLGSHMRIEDLLGALDNDKGKRDCRSGKKNNANAGGSGKGSKDQSQDQGQNLVNVWNSFVKYSVSLISEAPKTNVDAIAWWIDSGATTHVCKDYRGGEYYDPVFFQSVGSIHETTAPYTLQQNGVAERKNRALKEMVNSMLSYSGLSEGFWGEAMVVVRLPNPKRKTMGEKGIDCIFVEYAEHSKAYRDDHSDDVPSETPEPRRAIDDEIGSIMENNTWVLSDLPHGCKPLGCKWIFKRKMKVNGTIDKFRLLLALAVVHNLVIHQMDVKTAFLNGDLDEEVYMKQPEGFIMPGEADVILGIKIKRENKGTVITQSYYIEKILKKFNREDYSPLEYSRAIGCLMYAMTSTRPNIAYAVGRLSRFTSNPSRQHWQSITRVFKYLKGTMIYGLSYIGYPLVLEGYSDASWINHVEDLSFTSGWVFLLGGGAISWASKKQTCMTGSTMEFEFVALTAAGKEAEWLRNLIHKILIWSKPIAPISIHCNSVATLAKSI